MPTPTQPIRPVLPWREPNRSQARKSSEAGNPVPLRQEAKARRNEIFQGTLLECFCEYMPLRDYMHTHEITAINPRKTPEAMEGLRPDLVTSFYSFGFHYPVDDYADLMIQTLRDGGTVCLDLRKRYLKRGQVVLNRVMEAGQMDVLYDDVRSQRIVLRGG